MAERGSADQWVVYDADNGAVLARRELETVGLMRICEFGQ
jgi:hypothetical protein